MKQDRTVGKREGHNKVFTSKGLMRDRRVRLSAHTAIQLYDVQDRLGYDQPSKAIDWLIDKAKSAIDSLYDHPPINHEADIRFQDYCNVLNSDPMMMTTMMIQRESPIFSHLHSTSLLSLHASADPPIRFHDHADDSQSPDFDFTKGFSSGGFVGIS